MAAAAAGAGIEAPAEGLAEARQLALLSTDAPQRHGPGTWLLEAAYLKPYAAVRHAHYAAAAAIEARTRIADTGSIVAIRLETYAEALRYAGNRAPQAAITAQFSLSFAVAAGLRFGTLDPAVYRRMDDTELQRMEGLVALAEDAAMTLSGQRAARLVVQTTDGTVQIEIDTVPGDPSRPMTEPEVVAKFLRLTEGGLTEGGASAVGMADAVLRGDIHAPLRLAAF